MAYVTKQKGARHVVLDLPVEPVSGLPVRPGFSLPVQATNLAETAVQIKASAGQVTGWVFHVDNAADVYLHFHDAAPNDVVAGNRVFTVRLKGNAEDRFAGWVSPPVFDTAISVRATADRAGTLAPAAPVNGTVFL